jgi:hypothetical protein
VDFPDELPAKMGKNKKRKKGGHGVEVPATAGDMPHIQKKGGRVVGVENKLYDVQLSNT